MFTCCQCTFSDQIIYFSYFVQLHHSLMYSRFNNLLMYRNFGCMLKHQRCLLEKQKSVFLWKEEKLCFYSKCCTVYDRYAFIKVHVIKSTFRFEINILFNSLWFVLSATCNLVQNFQTYSYLFNKQYSLRRQ